MFPKPLGSSTAIDVVESWIARPCTRVVGPTTRHAAILRRLLQPLGHAGNVTNDAHLAALAIEHEAVVWSSDRDFSRFAGVRWRDPLRE